MFATLRVSEIGTIVLMYREAEAAFERSNMILEEVWVFVEILYRPKVSQKGDVVEAKVVNHNGFKCEFSKTFTAVGVGSGMRSDTTSPEFAPCSVLQ